MMDPQFFRIIDANRNRIAEGLRVLEDISRFLLNDEFTSGQIKSIRHRIVETLNNHNIQLINQRNSNEDVGSKTEPIDNQDKLVDIIMSNAKRVQEALRVIEEMTKLTDLSISIDSNEFKKTRFTIYDIERNLVSKTLRTEKTRMITGLYVILDTDFISLDDMETTANKIIKAGVKIIQLRDKKTDTMNLYWVSKNIRDLCLKNNVLFIVNDYVDIARLVNADGVHLGQSDLPVTVVRKELPVTTIIGCSVDSLMQAQKAMEEGADYIGIGAIFPTKTRDDTSVVGLNLINNIRKSINIPIVAIGGINKSNIAQVIASGADSAAVISVLFTEGNIEATARELIAELEKGYTFLQ